jgi:hypothetical protein
MRVRKIEAMNDVAFQLHETEKALDHALIQAAALAGMLPSARLKARLSGTLGQEALTSAMEAQRLLVRARGRIVTAHHQLNDVKTQIGLRTTAVGGGYEKPLTAAGGAANEDVAA